MTWQQFLTEKVLKECWHEWVHITPEGRDEYYDYNICKKCKEMWSGLNYKNNRTFDNRNDLLDLYEAIYRDGKWGDFSGGARWKHTMFSVEDFVEMSAWLFCLDGKGYEEKCRMVAEFYGWKESHD